MPDFGQPAALERAVFWVRVVGILLTTAGIMAIAVANYLSTRVTALRADEVGKLRAHVHELENRMAAPAQPAPQKSRRERYLTVDEHRALSAALSGAGELNVAVISALEWESGNYAHQLIKSLRIAGLNVRVTYTEANKSSTGLLLIHNGGNGGRRLAAALRAADPELVERVETPRSGAAAELYVGPLAQSPAAASAPASDAVK